ncbi:Uncharacterized protein K02A2.6 [Stylophora pistillata]|uniref:Uncharacterized protein K02A2.6 n=1 Tax=Stylophora pistillata TaxID=50429 RepID=A0A2B4S457_STYPI|nr:Uncharacterized protein K02A2.6 [Stylophora pistillata]
MVLKMIVNKLTVSNVEKPLSSSKEGNRKPNVIVLTEVILVVTVVVQQEMPSVRCHKIGHFAKVCQTKTVTRNKRFSPRDVPDKRRSNVNSIDDDNLKVENDDDEYPFTVGSGTTGGRINVLVGGISARMLIDSGASTNVIDKGTWEELNPRRLNANPIARVVLGDKVCEAEFVVIDGTGQPLLGRGTAIKLGVLQIGGSIDSVSSDIEEEFKDCFTGKKLDELENMDIIEKVNSPPQWVKPVVVVPKPNGKVRLCVDMRQANCADAEQYVRSCHGCQLVGQATTPQPLTPTVLPLGKWQDLSLDLLVPMPTGEYLLVVIDNYSRYYEVEILMSVNASQIIARLETIFAVHSLPVTIRNDSGPQFRSSNQTG